MNHRSDERGMALVLVLLVAAIFFVLVGAMLLTAQTHRAIAVNDEDYLKALNHVESGLSWAERRLLDVPDASTFMEVDDDEEEEDEDVNLLAIRSLTLRRLSDFNIGNEATASAIVERDFFGDGLAAYEVLRVEGSRSNRSVGNGPATRANVYVRIDDNPDETPNDPGANDPEVDSDGVVIVTAVSEYPVFVDGGGREIDLARKRPPARRAVRATYAVGATSKLPAIATNGSLDLNGGMKLCGDCGSAHANDDVIVNSGNQVCRDVTATDRYSGSTSGVAGEASGGEPRIELPIINPYDPIFLPDLDTFDSSSDTGLPVRMQCPKATASDPGANKLFALVADDGKGRVYKAYWDFANGGWTWTMIDNLADGTDVSLDDCGRVRGVDPNFGTRVDDGGPDEFYGFKGDKVTLDSCASCTSAGKDESLCDLANNDYGVASAFGGAKLPGIPAIDGTLDYLADRKLKDAKWDYSSNEVYSPVYGAVFWIYGNLVVSGNPANPSAVSFVCSGGTGCVPGNVPYGVWKASFVTVGDIELSGQISGGPANPAQGYFFHFIAGRDLKINGNPNEGAASCDFGCSTGVSTRAEHVSGIFAAHEQIEISGNPNIHGQLLAEDAIDCSTTVDGRGMGMSSVGGSPRIQYDCGYPPNPWDSSGGVEMLSWQEIE